MHKNDLFFSLLLFTTAIAPYICAYFEVFQISVIF